MGGKERDGKRETSECKRREEEEMDEERNTKPGEAALPYKMCGGAC